MEGKFMVPDETNSDGCNICKCQCGDGGCYQSTQSPDGISTWSPDVFTTDTSSDESEEKSGNTHLIQPFFRNAIPKKKILRNV